MGTDTVMDLVKAKLAALWTAAQVELQGQYSTQRVQALFTYSYEASSLRIFLVLLFTPLPCLMITTVVDLVHLRPTSAGVHGSQLFFARAFIAFWVASVMTYVQFKHIVASAPLSGMQIVGISAVVASLTVCVMYVLALVIDFPLPFSIVTVSPAWVSLLLLPLVSWMKTAHADPVVWPHVINSLIVMVCQETLIVIYPAYFYTFTTIPASWKTAFALLLPVIKLVLRNVMAHAVAHLNDEIPEIVILNVEVFSALFVAYCMQNTPSVKTTFVLMAVDALQMSASLYDIGQVVQRMKCLRRQSEAKRTLQVPSRRHSVEFNLAQTIFNRQIQLRRPSSAFSFRLVPSILKLSPTVRPLKDSLVEQSQTLDGPKSPMPSHVSQLTYGNLGGPSGLNLASTSNTSFDFQYIQELRRVLYITEFVVLLNYVEVVIPLIFSAYLFTIYHLPNRAYYEQIAYMDETRLRDALFNVVLYSALQLVSLAVLNFVLWRTMHFSVFRQLSFVLERQWGQVQHKLIFWVFYNVQASLQHFGSDYTFQFAWMQGTSS